MIKQKRGVGHVEVIISFLIFVSFVFFLMIIFTPFGRSSVSQSNLDVIERKIMKVITINLTKTSLILNSSVDFLNPGDCVSVRFPLPDNVLMKDSNKNIVEAYRKGDYLYFKYTGDRFYKVYSSPELKEFSDNVGQNCKNLAPQDYSRGITRIQEVVSSSKLENFFHEYSENYPQVKEDFGINTDFNIFIRDISDNILNNFMGERHKPKGVSVAAKDVGIGILDEKATLTIAMMNIQTWG